MPNYKAHLSAGFVVYLVLFYLVCNFSASVLQAAQLLLCCLIGSIFPDVDTKSKMQKIFYVSLLFVFIFLVFHNKIQLMIVLSFIGLAPLLVNHRGIFHKPWFIMLIAFSVSCAADTYCPGCLRQALIYSLFFVSGAISHIWLDVGFKKMFRF